MLSESESQIQIPEVEEHIWEDNILIQQQLQTPIPETEYRPPTQTTPEQQNRPSTPKAPRTTKKQLTPIEELAQHYELTKELKNNLAFYLLIVQKTLLQYYKDNNFPPFDYKEYLRQTKSIYDIYHLTKGKQSARPTLRERLAQVATESLLAILPSLGHAHNIQTPQKKPTFMATQTTTQRTRTEGTPAPPGAYPKPYQQKKYPWTAQIPISSSYPQGQQSSPMSTNPRRSSSALQQNTSPPISPNMRGSAPPDDNDPGDSGPDDIKDEGNDDDSPWEQQDNE